MQGLNGNGGSRGVSLFVSLSSSHLIRAFLIKKNPERIVIYLSRATYIDSAGVAALILAMPEAEAYGGKFFRVVCRKPYARFSKLRGLIEYFGFPRCRCYADTSGVRQFHAHAREIVLGLP